MNANVTMSVAFGCIIKRLEEAKEVVGIEGLKSSLFI